MKIRLTRTLQLVALSALWFSPLASAQDADGDFLTDAEELDLGTAPYDKDSDGDGIWDRDEVYSYRIVTSPTGFTFDEAMADAAAKGGWLAIIDSPQKLYNVKRGLLSTPLPSPMPSNNYDPATTLANPIWIGAHDKPVDGSYQWVKPGTLLSAPLEGALIGSAAYVNIMPGSATISNVVNINSFAVGRPFIASGVATGTTVTSINPEARTLTLNSPVDFILSQRVARIVVSNGGFGYNVPPYSPSNPAPVVSFSGATFGIPSVNVTAGGSGYSSANPPTLTFSGGGGTGAAAHAVVVGDTVTNIVLDDRGSNYTSTPTITITDNGGTGFTATVPALGNGPTTSVIVTDDEGRIQTIDITGDGATYYSSAPTVTISGNSGGGALASAILTPAASANVATVTMLSGGNGYTSQPTVTFTGGGGTGATGRGSINSSGQVTGVVILSYGSGYISTPTAVFTGGDGTGATASVTIRQFAKLVQSPVTGAYVNWSTGLLGNRVNSQEGVLLDAGAAFTWTTAVETESHSYLLELPPTDPTKADTDDDGLSDFEELNNSPTTDPNLADTDGDGVNDGLEVNTYHSNPTVVDTDDDGLSDGQEVNTHLTDPIKTDTDSDGVNDGLEVNTTHTNPIVADTDSDGLGDGMELNTNLTDPLVADTDGDGLSDGQEVNTHHTNPLLTDTDGDGFSDFVELNSYPPTDPNLAETRDADGDFLSDAEELALGTAPYDKDSDGDGIWDRDEVYSYQIVTRPTGFTFDEAVADAAAKGGWLAIINSPQKLYKIKRGLLSTPLPNMLTDNHYDPSVTLDNPLWIGAHDKLEDGRYQWVNPETLLAAPLKDRLDGELIGSAAYVNMMPGSATVSNVVNINSFVVDRPFVASGVPTGTTVTSIDAAARTLTLSNPVDSILSQRVARIVVSNGGFGYNVPPYTPANPAPIVTFSGATFGISSVNVTAGGSGYSSVTPPTLTFSGGGGSGAAAHAVVVGGTVTGVVIDNRGVNYTTPPTITINHNGGTGFSAITTAFGNGPTTSVTVTPDDGRIQAIDITGDGATYYSTAPTVSISGASGGGALASAVLTPAANANISTVTVLSGGSGYTSQPTVTFTGGGGTGATGVGSINSNGKVTGVVMLSYGAGYISTPTVVFTGGGGTGATASATIRQFSRLVQSPVIGAYVNWSADLLGNRVNSQEGVLLDAGAAFTWTTAVETESHSYLLELPPTDPTKADTDDDGLSDFEELNNSPTTDPNLADTDGDGVNDGLEVNTYHSNPTVVDTDDDGLSDGQEVNTHHSNPTVVDTDGDGLTDGQEVNTHSTDPTVADTDDDGLTDGQEVNTHNTNPLIADTDDDGVNDGLEVNTYHSNPLVADTDTDGLTDGQEVNTYNTNPILADTDTDGLTDGQEVNTHNTNPLVADTDDDGLTDGQEVNTHNTNPLIADTDNDGLSDGQEVNTHHTNPLVIDTDGDGVSDGQEVNTHHTDPTKTDTDGDGLSDFAELNSTPLTNPNLADTDTDGLNDGLEVNTYHSNPTVVDTDGDGLNDGLEVNTHHTNPILADTDGDGLTDGQEVNTYETNPLLADTDGDGLTDGQEVNTHNTNPTLADTDGDEVDDGLEINVLHTDPTRPFDMQAGTVQIPFASKLVSGSYEGLVYDPASGLSFRQKITISSNGSFSASISGLPKNAMKFPMDASYKGKFTALGEATKLVNAGTLVSVQMNVEKQGTSDYYIHGLFTTNMGTQLYFELHRSSYSKSKPYPHPSKVTFAASLDTAADGPEGHVVATGEIRSDGTVLFKSYLPDGSSSSSYSGPIVTGDIINLYTRSSAKSRTTLIGALAIRDIPATSDFDGTVRLFSNVEISSSLFPYGFDQFRSLIGSIYTPPSAGTLPLPNFTVSTNNALYLWIGGNFHGVEKVGTWSTNSRMVIPPTPTDSATDSAKATFVSKTGLMTLSYTRTDASRDLLKATSKGSSVVLQKNETFKGFYISSLSAGDFEVLPNEPNEDD